MDLTIALITMNRSKQLLEAIKSCINCALPEQTEFVIIDNASVDNTEAVIYEFFQKNNYQYCYKKLKENVGVGGGRNYAFKNSTGEFIYFMDDDAYIDYSKDCNFFIKAIEIFKKDERIATITTQIYDLAWKRNRVNIIGKGIAKDIYKQLFVCGGSHFLRASVFKNNMPYFEIKYGFEDLKPSLYSYDNQYCNIFTTKLTVIHNPSINKWQKDSDQYNSIIINYLANKCLILISVYPRIFKPIIYSIMYIRWFRMPNRPSFKDISNFIKEHKTQYSDFYKIRCLTVLKLFKDFGFSIF